jgi:transcriptional regulator
VSTEVAKHYTGYRNAGPKAKEAEEQRVLDMVVGGWTHREIAKELGMSMRTVANRQDTALARIVPTTVAKYRTMMNEQLDKLFRANVTALEAGDEKAIERAIRIIERKAKLNGVDAPIVVEATVVEVTQQERALADLLAQAERDQAVKEAEMSSDA